VLSRAEFVRKQEEALIARYRTQLDEAAAAIRADRSLSKLEKLIERKNELDMARSHALELIFDEEKYFYPYRQRANEYYPVQKEVDHRVAAVREIWDDPMKVRVALADSMKKHLAKFDEAAAELAKRYVDTPAMRAVQMLYPDPPLVLWVSNNEPPDLRWAKHGPLEKLSKRYLEKYGEDRSDDFRRRVMGEGWIERYRVMFDAMRGELENHTWRSNVRFVGYGAFGPAHMGRWGGWKVYSLHCDRWTSPDWYAWQGGSPSYYTDNWHDKRDDQVFSTQVSAMNWVFMLDEAWRVNPDFWFEISTWDGNDVKRWMQGLGVTDPRQLAARSSQPLSAAERKKLPAEHVNKSKALQYMKDGQTYPPERARGWVQYGMWLVRPRVVREFRGHATKLEPVLPYWMETVKAVDRVHNDDTLKEFWRHGRLVANTSGEHPYDTAIPKQYQKINRWYALSTNLDPPRPWKLDTMLPVFSLALVLGEQGQRRWLVYAHSPVEDRRDVEVTIPNYGKVKIDVPRGGAFYVVGEQEGHAERVAGK